jgi:hypothetical protein
LVTGKAIAGGKMALGAYGVAVVAAAGAKPRKNKGISEM